MIVKTGRAAVYGSIMTNATALQPVRQSFQYSTVVGWEGPSVPRGSLGLMGMAFKYCTPVSQFGFHTLGA